VEARNAVEVSYERRGRTVAKVDRDGCVETTDTVGSGTAGCFDGEPACNPEKIDGMGLIFGKYMVWWD